MSKHTDKNSPQDEAGDKYDPQTNTRRAQFLAEKFHRALGIPGT